MDDRVHRRRGPCSAVDDRQGARGGVSWQPRAARRHVAAGGEPQERADQRRRRRQTVHLAAPNVAGTAGRRRRSAGAERHGGARRPRRRSSRECRSRSRVSGSRRSPSGYRLPPNNKRVDDPTMNMSRQVVENPGTPGVQDVTFAIAKVNGVGNRQTASSQCHRYPGHRWGAAGGHQAGYGSASCEQWRHLGCARPM